MRDTERTGVDAADIAVRLSPLQRLALVTLAALLAVAWLPLERSDLWPLRTEVFDTFQRLHPRQPSPEFQVQVVAIDEASLERYGQWPWPRTLLARLIERVTAAGAVAVALDMVMAEPDRLSPQRLAEIYPDIDAPLAERLRELPTNDDLLAQVIASHGRVVLGRAGVEEAPVAQRPLRYTPYVLQGGDDPDTLADYPALLPNIAPLQRAAAGLGLVNAVPEADGVARRVPLVARAGGELLPSLALELLRVAFRQRYFTVHVADGQVAGVSIGDRRFATDADGAVTLHFSPAYEARRLSAADLLDGLLPSDVLANKIAFIGVTGLGIADAPPTPVQGRMDGVEIQAQVAESLLAGSRLERPAWAAWAESAGLLVVAVALLALSRYGSAWAVPAGLAVLASLPAAAYAAFLVRGWLLDPGFGVCAALLCWAVAAGLRRTEADRRRRALMAALEAERLQRARLDGELGAARDIQTAMLESVLDAAARPEGLDWHALVKPAREVGGDLYQVLPLADGRLFFLVGDVSGKGAPAALFMALTKALVASAARRNTRSASEIVAAAQSDLDRENPMALFVTAVCGVLDGHTGDVELVIAGHDAPIAVMPDGRLRELSGVGGPPLGVVEDFAYSAELHRLEPGERLLLYTDGVTEAQDPAGRLFGHERLREVLVSAGTLTARALAERVRDSVVAFAAGTEAADDMTVLVIARAPLALAAAGPA